MKYQMNQYVNKAVLKALAVRGILDESLESLPKESDEKTIEDKSQQVLKKWGISTTGKAEDK